jgi:hypothetical protein
MSRQIRQYIRSNVDSLQIQCDRRSSITEREEPDVIVWIGFDKRGEMSRILPVLIHSNIDNKIESTVAVHHSFGESKSDEDRILTPIFHHSPAVPTDSDWAKPEYDIQIATTDNEGVEDVNITAAQDYAMDLAAEGRESQQIKAEFTAIDEIPYIEFTIRGPGLNTSSLVPVFDGEPTTDKFQAATNRMQLPCVILAESRERVVPDSSETFTKLPYVSD